MSNSFITSHRELKLYEMSFESAMQIFNLVQDFPPEERTLLTEQVIKSSRSVCANLAEAWYRRRYKKAFVAKLNEVEAEAAETQTWIEFAIVCNYLDAEVGQEVFGKYTAILAGANRFIEHAEAWVVS